MQVEFNEDGDGFWAKFDNGWTMSVQWNPRNYAGVKTQEIAAWDEDDTVWWDFEAGKPVSPSSYVLGWVTSDKLGGYMNDIASITQSSTELQLIARTGDAMARYLMEPDSILLPHNPLRGLG